MIFTSSLLILSLALRDPELNNFDHSPSLAHKRRHLPGSTIIFTEENWFSIFATEKISVTIIIEDVKNKNKDEDMDKDKDKGKGKEISLAYLNEGDLFVRWKCFVKAQAPLCST